MRIPAAAAGKRSVLAAGSFAAGAAGVILALAADVPTTVSPPFDLKQATLLIAGCDLVVLGLIVSAPPPLAADTDGDLASLMSTAIADGVMSFGIAAAAVIVLLGQSKPIERLGYFLAILVVVPLIVTLAWRRQRAGLTGERRGLLGFATLAAIAVVLCVARELALPTTGALDTSLFLLLALLALLALRVGIALSARVIPTTWRCPFPAKAALALTPVLLALAAVPFVPPATLSTVDIAIALVSGLATFGLVLAFGDRRGPPRAWARPLDVGIVAFCALVVFYLGRPVETLAANHNYFLAPATDVLHGHPMLVGTFSQYGFGLMDVLAAVFLVVPLGYGTFTLLLSGLTVLFFTGFYVILRWSTESLLLPAIGLTVVVTLYVFGQIDVYAFFPSTGVLRFGLEWAVVLCSVAAARTDHRRHFDALVLAIVAVAAAWSGEAGSYCLGTACALACVSAAVADASTGERLRMGARRLAALFAASAIGLLTFTLATRAGTGDWPDWGPYFELIRLYTTGGLGAMPIEPWSPGLALGAMYTVSAIAIVLLVLVRPALVRERAVAFRAATGLTALGVLVYTYYLGRAHPNNLIHISPPAVALLFVWLGIVRSTFDSRVAVAVASGTVISLGAMIVASERANIGQKYPRTALAAVLGSAPWSLDSELAALWHNPVVAPLGAHVATFVSSLKDKGTSLTILLTPTIETEALLRLGTANAVGSSNPCQESLSQSAPKRVAAAVRSLRPGGILVISVSPTDAGLLLPIEKYTFVLLRGRFTLHEIATDGRGLFALRMSEPQPATASGAAGLPTGPPSAGCA